MIRGDSSMFLINFAFRGTRGGHSFWSWERGGHMSTVPGPLQCRHLLEVDHEGGSTCQSGHHHTINTDLLFWQLGTIYYLHIKINKFNHSFISDFKAESNLKH